MKKSFLTIIVALFAIGTTSVYGQFVNPVVGGNVMLTTPTNNVVIGPLPPTTTQTTSLYLNNGTVGPSNYSPTIFTIDNNIGNNTGPTVRTSQLNFNTGGINYFKLYMTTGGTGCGGGGFHIMPTSTGAGIHLQGTGIAFSNSEAGATCGNIFAYGKYVFDGAIGSLGLNIGYGNNFTPPSGYLITNAGQSYFKDKVVIGTTNTAIPTGTHKLYVGGSIICEELFVKLQANWPDYVFAPSYKLMPLSQVKTYIAANNHLPGIPAAAEVAKTGVATGEMLTIQMKKIEELTLYLIQMEERIKELELKNKTLLNK